MFQRKRIRRGTAGWLQLVSRCAGSGMSVRDFCRREGINATLFRRWQSRLAGSEYGGKVSTAVEVAEPFIDLGDLRSNAQRLEVRLDLGGGIILSIARG
jgi:hypothetical protein